MIKNLLKTLKFKIALLVIILLLITASIFTLLTVQTMNRHILDEVIKRAESLCKSTAAVAPYSILSGDILGVDNIVSKVKAANPDVEYVIVTNSNMKIVAHSDVKKRGEQFRPPVGTMIKKAGDGTSIYEVRDGKELFEILTPMIFKDRHVGSVIIGVNKSVLLQAGTETRKRITAGLGIALLLGIGSTIVLSSFLTRPIQELSMGVRDLKKGKRSQLRIYSQDELGDLTESCDQMAEVSTREQMSGGESAKRVEGGCRSTVKVLAAAIDARDPYTLGHSTRVSKLALKIGQAMGLSSGELEDLEIASLFHDVGKLRTPDYLLLKEGQLDPLERNEIANHSEQGAAILSRASSLQKYIPSVRHHHEWYNGEGYPDGLRGDDIPLHAAIIAVADAFDAMTSARPYKKPRSCDDALRELTRFSGKQFHPGVVKIFHQVIEAQPIFHEQFLRGEW